MSWPPGPPTRVVYLSGGVGGARLLRGLVRALAPGSITAIVNTGDDFEHLGLHIAPDLDTVLYTLAGLADEERGWGLRGESFAAMEMIKRLGGPAWFALGDRDLATHLLRSQALAGGASLSAISARLFAALGVTGLRVLPMSDAPCRTMIDGRAGATWSFQEWFVGRRAEPEVRRVWWAGQPQPAPGVLAAIDEAELAVIGPSNPYVSIDPILALEGVRAALARRPVVAVSPIVGGRAIKGPLAAMIRSLGGVAPSAGAIVRHYAGLLSGLLVEEGDEEEARAAAATLAPGRVARVAGARTIMSSMAESLSLARALVEFAQSGS